ncbi:hypothetical protein D3C71_2167510 [compost metagenome]
MMQYWADLLDALEVGVSPPKPEAYMAQSGRRSMDFLSMQQESGDNSMGARGLTAESL